MKRLLLALLWLALAVGAPAPTRSAPPLRVGVKEAPPFAIAEDDGSWSGIGIELWKHIAEEMELEYELRAVDFESGRTGIESGTLDLVVGAVTVTAERETRYDFTHPYFVSTLGIAVRSDDRGGVLKTARQFVSPALIRVVGTLALVLFASGLLIWAFERKRNPEQFGGRASSGIGSGFWWAAVTMTTVGYGDKAPVTPAGRFVALLWMFTSLIVISAFTAAIASALTVGGLSSTIEGPEDLPTSRVASVGGTASADWLEDNRIRFAAHDDVELALEALRAGRSDALVYDTPILRYLVQQDPEGRVTVLARTFRVQPYAFVLAPNSELREPLNRALLSYVSTREWADLVFRYTGVRW